MKHVVDHIDTNKCNNRSDNLRWVSRKLSGSLEVDRFEYKIGEGTKPMMVDETAKMEIIAVIS